MIMKGELCESGRGAIAPIVVVSVSTCGSALRGGEGEWGKLDWILQH